MLGSVVRRMAARLGHNSTISSKNPPTGFARVVLRLHPMEQRGQLSERRFTSERERATDWRAFWTASEYDDEYPIQTLAA